MCELLLSQNRETVLLKVFDIEGWRDCPLVIRPAVVDCNQLFKRVDK